MVQVQTVNQALVLSGVLFCTISDGFIFGQMSGMLASLQTENSTISLNDDDVSWLASTINVTCVCGFALVTLLSEFVGRGRAITILSTPIIFTWIALYFAQDVTTLHITRIVVGACFGGVLTLTFLITGEYSPPNIRGFYLNLISSVGPAVGTGLGHILGIIFHWRTVALLGIIPTGLSAILPCFWKESPSWLASKGKYEECEKSFRSLHVKNEASERELQLLIKMEKSKETEGARGIGKKIKMLKTKEFRKVMEFSAVISVYRAAAGKTLFSTFAITILQDLTGKGKILLATLLVDGFAILGSCLSCLFIRRMNMRTLYFSSATIANTLLFTLSACVYFGPNDNVQFRWLNAVLLALYFITINSGPYPVLEAFLGEIFPLKIKELSVLIFGCLSSISMFISIKLAPEMFASMGYHGVFFTNAVIMLLCGVYFWVRMPETKGRTLQEIESYFKNNRFDNVLRTKEQNQLLLVSKTMP